MGWSCLTEVRHAHLRARFAERSAEWHLVIKEYLFCLEAAERAQDVRAIRFFALQLAHAYSAIGMPHKAGRYRELGAVPTELR
jgi:hypothetical protein